mgnify:CR=1 FL=1
MTSVERLSDVRRGELYDDALASLGWVGLVLQSEIWVAAKLLAALEDGWDEDLSELVDLEEEGEERSVGLWLLEESGFWELGMSALYYMVVGALLPHTFSAHSRARSCGFLPLMRRAATGRIRSPLSRVMVHCNCG